MLRTALFINAHSRRANRLRERVVRDFTKRRTGFAVVETIIVEDLKELDGQLQTLASIPDLECVIVASGDGTIVSVLNALKDRKLTYGFLPLGTSNSFMRSLGLPLTYMAARKTILNGEAKAVSLGSINGVVFPNIAGIGVPVEVTETTTNKIKKILGPLAYIFTGIRAILGHNAVYCHIENDEITESFYTHYLIIANGKYHGNLPLGKDISAYNDQLTLMAVGVKENVLDHIVAIFTVLLRRHEKDKRVKMLPFEKLTLTTQPQKNIEADGEIISRTPAFIEVKKDAILVIAKAPKPSRPPKRGKAEQPA